MVDRHDNPARGARVLTGALFAGLLLAVGLLVAGLCMTASYSAGAHPDSSDNESPASSAAADDGDRGASDGVDEADARQDDSGSDELDDLGDTAPPAGSEPEGATLKARMDAYLDANVPRTHMPGVAVAVVDAKGIRYMRTLGDCPGMDAPFIIGSLSKSFTAVAIMQLVEQGRVDLDAPAARYASGYDIPDKVTVRMLLNQTSGFGYYDALADAQVGGSFGSFSYANANYDLLGRIIEGVTGEDYATYLKEQVLAPLGMTDSSAEAAALSAPGITPGHRDWFGLPVADGFVHAMGDDAWGGPSSGYVTASVRDMALYLQMYLNGGANPDGTRILDPSSVSSMFLDRVPDPDGDTYYGMGWTSFNWDDGELVLSHDGQVENYVASMCLLPQRGLGVVVLGDANDNIGGNSLFFDVASGVVGEAVGDEGGAIDNGWVAAWRQRVDVLYACAVIASMLPLLLTRRWMRGLAEVCGADCQRGRKARRLLLARGMVLHVVAPLAVLGLPFAWGARWRDLLTFAPDVSAVLVTCSLLLVGGGIAKLIACALVRKRLRSSACGRRAL